MALSLKDGARVTAEGQPVAKLVDSQRSRGHQRELRQASDGPTALVTEAHGSWGRYRPVFAVLAIQVPGGNV